MCYVEDMKSDINEKMVSDCSDIKLKNEPNKPMLISVGTVTASGVVGKRWGRVALELDQEETQGNLWAEQNVLYLDLGSSYRGVYILLKFIELYTWDLWTLLSTVYNTTIET